MDAAQAMAELCLVLDGRGKVEITSERISEGVFYRVKLTGRNAFGDLSTLPPAQAMGYDLLGAIGRAMDEYRRMVENRLYY